jgi:D-amino-acid dehydrogenase
VAVVGAGMVGLATAWHLQEAGVEVTIFDRAGVAAGSSWGNAGWLTPALATPLPEPAVLLFGLRALFNPSSPLYVPFTTNPRLLSFLLRFAAHSTAKRWRHAMGALAAVNRQALGAYDHLVNNGVAAPTSEAKQFLAAFRTEAERQTLLDELRQINNIGQPAQFEAVSGDEARELEPALSPDIGAALRLYEQRFINPGEFVESLADSVREQGGQIVPRATVTGVDETGGRVRLGGTLRGAESDYDAVVLATGSWLGELARQFGVRTIVQAGRGYSFSVDMDQVPSSPVYLPTARVACTPLGDRFRIAGMMEFRGPNDPLDQRRVEAIVDSTRPLLTGADFDHRLDEWVGARPCTPDGLPLIGRTRSARVFCAGGHGMWGIVLGPITGNLITQAIVDGATPGELAPFDPLR